MMTEIKAAVDPDAIVRERDILLGVDGPAARGRDDSSSFRVYEGHVGGQGSSREETRLGMYE